MLTQEVDAIIAEENLSDSNPSVVPDETPVNTEEPETPDENVDKPSESDEPDTTDTPDEADKPIEDDKPVEDKPVEKVDDPTPDNVVDLSSQQTAPSTVQFDDAKIFDEQGQARPFEDVVNVGEYLSNQIKPVEVVGKDGNVYKFHVIKDVEDQFPEGFEAKNSIEKLKFESAIVANDNKFRDALGKISEAKQEYEQYTTEAIQVRTNNARIGNEYKAMADQGLVPKVGDPNDPKFLESDAVKELNNILGWMDKTNAENATKGLGKIESLYVAKQLMDADTKKVEKVDRAKQIDQERKEVASLSSSPSPDRGNKKPSYDIPMSRLADSIIAEEGLR